MRKSENLDPRKIERLAKRIYDLDFWDCMGEDITPQKIEKDLKTNSLDIIEHLLDLLNA